MARVDKTDSAVGVFRADLAADIVTGDLDTVIGVGLNASGQVVKGSGQTGIVGVMVPSKYQSKAGQAVDVFVLADIVECEGLAAGTAYYAAADGTIGTTNTDVAIGFTVEADRLLVRL
jgi:hypothetical protein